MSTVDDKTPTSRAVKSIEERRQKLPVITLEELAKHTGENDCWIAIGGIVYNVSEYLKQHPGGPEVILCSAGKDVSVDFEEIGHSANARSLAIQYEVGVLEGHEETATGTEKPPKNTAGTENSDGGSGTVVISVILLVIAIACYYIFALK